MDKESQSVTTYILAGIVVIIILIGTIILILSFTILAPEANVGVTPCTDRTNGLINVSGTPCYFNYQGKCSLNRYTDEILGGTFLYTSPVNYTVSCGPLCVGYLDSNWNCCADDNPDCLAMKTSYDECVNTVKPNNCNGEAMPVAIDSNILYYVGQVISDVGAIECDCRTIGM